MDLKLKLLELIDLTQPVRRIKEIRDRLGVDFVSSWRLFIYGTVGFFALSGVIFSLGVSEKALEEKQDYEQALLKGKQDLLSLNKLKFARVQLQDRIQKLDRGLPGLAFPKLDLFVQGFNSAVFEYNWGLAEQYLQDIDELTSDLVKKQNEIALGEIGRLRQQIDENLKNVELLLGNVDVVPEDKLALIEDGAGEVLARLSLARDAVKKTSAEIKRRRTETDTAQKQIVIKKSEKKLYLFENGEEVFSMPVSLGRPGAATRSGDFEILDKLGTVWSVWQIWLPEWMGIYFAGASENGIHGLPYDHSGRVYWQKEVGKQNITFGCVMPDDPDMAKLYEWAEVGVPVAIVQ